MLKKPYIKITFILHFEEEARDGAIWIDAVWSDVLSSFVYLPNDKQNSPTPATGNKSMIVFDENYIKVGATGTTGDHATITGRYNDTSLLFTLNNGPPGTKAMTVCRASTKTTKGIQALNLMFDPSKESDRTTKVELAKEKYHEDFDQINISKSYEKLFELLWYTRLPCFDVKHVTSKEKDEMSVIKRCYWRGKMVDCASIFVTRSTDHGMCCTFNLGNAEKIFKDTIYGNISSDMQKRDKQLSFKKIISLGLVFDKH